MEKRLIDANKLIQDVENLLYKGNPIVAFIQKQVDKQPTVDTAPRWIPCEERLPEKEEKAYLVYLDNGHVCDCKWWCKNLISLEPTEQWRWDIFDLPQYGRVLAWMPLPDPYVGERKGDD